jgi:hypothetical protein
MGRFLQVLGSGFLVQQLYGSRYAPHVGMFNMPHVYVKAMIYGAGADELTAPERQYVRGLVELLLSAIEKYDDRMDLLQFIDALPSKQAACVDSVIEFLSGSLSASPSVSRVMLYDAIKAACADGEYDTREAVHVHHVAKQLGVAENVTVDLENIVLKEQELSRRKENLLKLGIFK